MPEKVEYSDTIIKLSDALEMLKSDNVDVKTKNIYLKAIVANIEFSRENTREFILDIDLK